MDTRQGISEKQQKSAPPPKKRFTQKDAYKSYQEGYMLNTYASLFSAEGTFGHSPQHASLFSKKPAPKYGDRFIPKRTTSPEELAIQRAKLGGMFDDDVPSQSQNILCEALLNKPYKAIQDASIFNLKIPSYDSRTYTQATKQLQQLAPYQIKSIRSLEGTGLIDDFYINPISWGEQHGVYLGLSDSLYHYDISLGAFTPILTRPNAYITALTYHSHILADASSNNAHQINFTNTETNTKISTLSIQSRAHVIIPDAEYGFYALSKSTHLENYLIHYDIRTPHPTLTIIDKSPIGLSLSKNKGQLAINTADGTMLFDQRSLAQPIWQYNGHGSANSKAIAFSPSGQYLATGGGCEDRKIKIWDTSDGKNIAQVNAKTQICNIHWVNSKSLFITTGFLSPSVSCWSYNESTLSLDMKVSLPSRVLFSAQNPTNRTELVTGSPNEGITFWSMFRPRVNTSAGMGSSKVEPSSYAEDLRRKNMR